MLEPNLTLAQVFDEARMSKKMPQIPYISQPLCRIYSYNNFIHNCCHKTVKTTKKHFLRTLSVTNIFFNLHSIKDS